MSVIRDFLQSRTDQGLWSIGQLAVAGLSLRHLDDAGLAGLEIFRRPQDARELAKYDDAGNYRPLKTAPNLRHGWTLQLSSLGELHAALDFFYPAALGTWLADEHSALPVIPLRTTLDRQSGMYRVTQLITDEQATQVIEDLCRKGCLRTRLWDLDSPLKNRESNCHESSRSGRSIGNPVVLCAEACNLLIAACRPIAKQNLPKSEMPS